MANDPSKTEEATPKRVEKTREEGRVAKSQEVDKAVTIAAGTFVLLMYIEPMTKHMSTIFRHYLGEAHTIVIDAQSIDALFISVAQDLAILILPVILFIGLMVFIALRMQVGALWSTKVFEFDAKKFNPLNGLKNMVMSVQAFVRLGKTLIQSLIIGYVPYLVIVNEFDNFLPLYNSPPEAIAAYMLNISLKMVTYTLIPMSVIAGVDLWYTRYQYNESIKMSKDEVKDERKQQEGDQMIKSRQKQKMLAMMAKRMLSAVPTADVVVTNPTHIAVALRYNTTEAPAPMVVAMGVNHLAEKIKEIARQNNIPIRENVPLARALYSSVEVGDMIPEDLYKAVASILASIWKIKGKMPK